MSVVSIDSKFVTFLFSQPELNKRIGKIDIGIIPVIHLVVAGNVKGLIFCLNLLSSDTLVSRVHAFLQAHKEHVALGHACACIRLCGGGEPVNLLCGGDSGTLKAPVIQDILS